LGRLAVPEIGNKVNKLNKAISGTIFLFVFAVYAYTAYPTIAPRDSADLAAAALTARPAHPPGYAFYVLLGRAWLTLVPWGDAAFRLNLMASAAGAGAATGVFLLLSRCCGFWPGLGAALALALSLPLWKFSLLCEMYSLQALFLSVLLLLAPGPDDVPSSVSLRAALSALLFGLGLVNHQALILAGPGLAVLWWEDLRRKNFWRLCFPLVALGLGLNLFLWVRTGSGPQAWAMVTRQEYGTWQLSAGLSRPWSASLALDLLRHFAVELGRGTSWLVVLLGLFGAVELRRCPRFAGGLAISVAGLGPVFFLMTRFDVSGWVARTVLESALVAPTVVLCVAAGFGLAWVARRWAPAAAILATAIAVMGCWRHGSEAYHRDDFSAYDYVKDLRRALPPGSVAVAAGDTALYGTRYLDLTRPDGSGRKFIDSQDPVPAEKPGYVFGLPLDEVERLGWGRAKDMNPAGLVQTWARTKADAFWDVSVLRPGRALRRAESYARDVLLSYAFAHYLSGQLLEAGGDLSHKAGWHYMRAAALDPEDYQIEYNETR